MNTEIYETILSSDTVPEFARVSFDIERSRMDDLSAEIDRTLEQRGVLQRIRPGDRIALTASSREITNLKWILRRLCERVKAAWRTSVHCSGDGQPWRRNSNWTKKDP